MAMLRIGGEEGCIKKSPPPSDQPVLVSYLFDVKNKQQISMFETNFAWTFSNALSFVVKNLPSRKMLITCH